MTPERAAALAARWTRRLVRDLPPDVAARRVEEVDADLHDHIAHERAAGTAEARIALAILSRLVRGLPADAAWRRSTRRTPMRSSLARVAIVTACVLLVPFAGMQVSAEVDWSVGDFVLAGGLVAGCGLLLELALKRPAALGPRVAMLAIGVASIVSGNADDAPGLVLFGLLLIAGTVALAMRTARGRAG